MHQELDQGRRLIDIIEESLSGQEDLGAGFKHRLTEALSTLKAPLTENNVWPAIAGSHSRDWKRHWDALQLHDAPLGLVGIAFGDEYSRALVAFTPVNEALRQRDDLHGLMHTLLARSDVIEPLLKREEKPPVDVTPGRLVSEFLLVTGQFFGLKGKVISDATPVRTQTPAVLSPEA